MLVDEFGDFVTVLWFVVLQSPADMCSKIEKGDEVLQVNGQTVVSSG